MLDRLYAAVLAVAGLGYGGYILLDELTKPFGHTGRRRTSPSCRSLRSGVHGLTPTRDDSQGNSPRSSCASATGRHR